MWRPKNRKQLRELTENSAICALIAQMSPMATGAGRESGGVAHLQLAAWHLTHCPFSHIDDDAK